MFTRDPKQWNSVSFEMFSPPPGGTPRLRRNIKPYKLAPIQREMFIQEAISDSPFYSTSAVESNDFQRLPPIFNDSRQSAASSIPMLIMTDDGGDDWEVLSEVNRLKSCIFNELYNQ